MATATDDPRLTAMLAVKDRARRRLRGIKENRERYDRDFPIFAADCLKIRPKTGGDMLFRVNAVQRRVHGALEDQRVRTGKVRAIILKARQPGISTYVGGRYYWRVSRNKGLRAFILTHEQQATDNVFEMVKRFHDNNPHAPRTGASSAKELYFSNLDSGFMVGTAGSKGVGRSFTIQYLHLSEVAWWPSAEDHAAGLLQAVPNAPGTEIIMESTANGAGGLFYNMCMAAMRGIGDFELIFIPWFEHEEYRLDPPDGWSVPAKFAEYADVHGIDLPALYWAWKKNAELASADNLPDDDLCWRFRQEYPATAEDAFRASRVGSFISTDAVVRARRAQIGDQSHAPKILGCDFATGSDGEGGDNNVFIDRQGRRLGGQVYQRFREGNVVEVANRLSRLIDRFRPDMCFLDIGGGGKAVYDILSLRGYGDVMTLVNFGSKASDDKRYRNKRAEMWGGLRDWLADVGGAQIPDENLLDQELLAPNAHEDANQRIIIEKKDEIRKRLGASPDGGDAACFVASTLIATPTGDRPIEELNVGDIVLTPLGASKIVVKWETETTLLTAVKFSNGATLEGKGDHRIFVFGDGSKRLDALSLTDGIDTVCRLRRWAWQIASLSFIGVRNSGFKQLVDITKADGRATPIGFFIAGCGLTTTALYRTAMRFITKTATGATTPWRTWSVCQRSTISAPINSRSLTTPERGQKTPNGWSARAWLQRSGMGLQRGWSGTDNMAGGPGKIASSASWSATVAGKASAPSMMRWPNTVRALAHRLLPTGGISRIRASALGAGTSLLRISIARPRVVPVSVQTESAPPTLVYNLTLERDNAYYANGVLAFNCLTFAEPVRVGNRGLAAARAQNAVHGAGDPIVGY